MSRILKKFYLLAGMVLLLCLPTPLLSAQGSGEVNPLSEACRNNSGATLCKDNSIEQSHGSNSIYGRNGIITKATRIISMVAGVAAIIVLIIAGLRYVLASGDPANVTKARNTITYALVGIAVAAAAQGIVVFVLDKL